jgi:hypothetical protein
MNKKGKDFFPLCNCQVFQCALYHFLFIICPLEKSYCPVVANTSVHGVQWENHQNVRAAEGQDFLL